MSEFGSENLTPRMMWLLDIAGPEGPLDPSVKLTPRMKRLLKIARAEDARAKPFAPPMTPRLRWALGIPDPSKDSAFDEAALSLRVQRLLDAAEPPKTVTIWTLGPKGYWSQTFDYDPDYDDHTEGYDERRRRLFREAPRCSP